MGVIKRKLIQKDRVILSNLLLKYSAKGLSEGILSMIDSDALDTGKPQNDNERALINLGVDLLGKIAIELQEDIKIWFASLIGVTPEEFEVQDFDIEMQIIEELAQDKNFKHFFFGLFQKFNSIQKFLPRSGTAKEK